MRSPSRSLKQVVRNQEHLAAADPQDLRSQVDVQVVLDDEASAFEWKADPALAGGSDRMLSLASARNLLAQSTAIMEKMVAKEPSNDEWKSILGDSQVRLATAESALHDSGDVEALAKSGLAGIRDEARSDGASPRILDLAANDFSHVEPDSLRDPQFAVLCAERAVALSRRKRPVMLLTLAQAYRAAGQVEKSRSAANEALALLAPLQPGVAKGNMRKLLEVQAQAGK